jgi:diguanylate cyclase (GGDEF)-like protein/PAS domain S-box-containing protein
MKTNQGEGLRNIFPSPLTIALTMLCAVVLINAGASYYNISGLAIADEWVRHSLQVRQKLLEVDAAAVTAETAEREFAVTGGARPLDEYGAAVTEARAARVALEKLTEDNADQQRRLNTVQSQLEQKIDWMGHVLNLRTTLGREAALAAISTGQGPVLLARVRNAIDEMEREEDRLLARRTAAAADNLDATIVSLAIFTVAALLLALLVAYATQRDRRNRARSEQVLFSSNQMLQTVLNTIPQRVFWKDLDSRYLGGNRTFANDAGFDDPAQIVGKSDSETVFAAHAAAYRADDATVVETGVAKLNYEEPIAKAGRVTGWLETNKVPLRGMDGNVIGVLGTYEDITERKRLDEQRLLQAKALEASVNGIFITSATKPDCPIEYVNAAAEKITGYTAQEFIGRNCRFLQGEETDQPGRAAIHYAISEQRSTNVLLRNYRKDGTAFWNDLKIAPVRTSDGMVSHYVGVLNDVTDRIRYEEDLKRQANFDSLTGLPNRALLADRIDQAIAHVNRSGGFFALAVLDLDNFKLANDGHGHAFGDEVLVEIGKRLQAVLRADDTVARYGGDEFVLLISCRGEERFAMVLERVLSVIAEPIMLDGNAFYVTGSIGVSTYPGDGVTGPALLSHADTAMYRAKEGGRNRFEVFQSDMTQRIHERIVIERGLRTAMERGELFLQYQPQLTLANGAVEGVEALVRWKHPEHGLIPPNRFIPVAEQSGLIVPMGEWILRTACAQAKAWCESGMPLVVAVNLSAIQFRQKGFAPLVANVLRETGLPARYLELEITESLLMSEAEEALTVLTELKDMGLCLSIDDFGTGYSSLSYLKRLPVDKLKIDQSFVRNIPGDRDDVAIARAVVSLGRSLELRVIAEGVETAEQCDFLRQLGCDEIQGYYFSRPIDAANMHQVARQLIPA